MAFDLDEEELEATKKLNGVNKKEKTTKEIIAGLKDLICDRESFIKYQTYIRKRLSMGESKYFRQLGQALSEAFTKGLKGKKED